MKTLVIETAFLGDVIISLALARELKRLEASAEISYLVRPDSEEVIRACPDVDNVIVFDKRGTESGRTGLVRKADELNAKGFDTVILLHSSRRSQMLCESLHAPIKVGFGFMGDAGLTASVVDSGWTNRYERAILPLTALFERVDITATPRLYCSPLPSVTEFSERFRYTVVIAPGSAWETKKWGDAKYTHLAAKLSALRIGVIVIGMESDRPAGQRIQSVCNPHSVLDLTGRTTFVESGGAIAAASLLVANDSAPVHLAVAVGTPVIAIFGPTVPSFGFAPPEGKGEVVEADDVWCRPCTAHGSRFCPIYSHDCMESIEITSVLDQVMNALPA